MVHQDVTETTTPSSLAVHDNATMETLCVQPANYLISTTYSFSRTQHSESAQTASLQKQINMCFQTYREARKDHVNGQVVPCRNGNSSARMYVSAPHTCSTPLDADGKLNLYQRAHMPSHGNQFLSNTHIRIVHAIPLRCTCCISRSPIPHFLFYH